MKKFIIFGCVVVAAAMGIITLQSSGQTGMEVIERVPPPTAHPPDEEEVRRAVEEFMKAQERLEKEGTNYVKAMSGIETLGADLNPIINVKLPSSVYIRSRTVSQTCLENVKCAQVHLPAYHFGSINTDVVYTIDAHLNEYFSGDLTMEEEDDLTAEEKMQARKHFEGVLEQFRQTRKPKPKAANTEN